MFKAIDNAYHAMLPKSGYPFAMLHLRVDPAAIDVNVHPAKTEIKFSDEQAVYRAIYRSIVTALVEQEKPEDMAKTIEPPSEEKTVAAPGVQEFHIAAPHSAPTSGTSSPVSAAPLPEAATLFTVDKGPSAAERNSCGKNRVRPFLLPAVLHRPRFAKNGRMNHRFVRATAAASFPRPWPSTVRVGALWMHPLRCQNEESTQNRL